MSDTFETSASAQRIATARVALASASCARGDNPAVCDEAVISPTPLNIWITIQKPITTSAEVAVTLRPTKTLTRVPGNIKI